MSLLDHQCRDRVARPQQRQGRFLLRNYDTHVMCRLSRGFNTSTLICWSGCKSAFAAPRVRQSNPAVRPTLLHHTESASTARLLHSKPKPSRRSCALHCATRWAFWNIKLASVSQSMHQQHGCLCSETMHNVHIYTPKSPPCFRFQPAEHT